MLITIDNEYDVCSNTISFEFSFDLFTFVIRYEEQNIVSAIESFSGSSKQATCLKSKQKFRLSGSVYELETRADDCNGKMGL